MGKPGRYEAQAIEPMILNIRGQKVILDADLARIYGVPTKRLNEQVRRNADRFPPDFAFVLTDQNVTNLKSQIATSSLSLNRPPSFFVPLTFQNSSLPKISKKMYITNRLILPSPLQGERERVRGETEANIKTDSAFPGRTGTL